MTTITTHYRNPKRRAGRLPVVTDRMLSTAQSLKGSPLPKGEKLRWQIALAMKQAWLDGEVTVKRWSP